MNIAKPNLSRPVMMGGWLTDLGAAAGGIARSAADIWSRATAPTVITTEAKDNTPLYIGLAGIGLVGMLLVMKKPSKRRR